MNIGTNKVSKKATLIVITVAILGVLAGSAGTYYGFKKNNYANEPPKPPVQSQEAQIQFEDKVPAGTLSPTTIVGKPSDYIGKDIKVRGILVTQSKDKYLLVGQEKDKPSAVSLDAAKNKIDPMPYVSGYSNSKDYNGGDKSTTQQVGAVTVTGTINSGAQGLILTVQKIEF